MCIQLPYKQYEQLKDKNKAIIWNTKEETCEQKEFVGKDLYYVLKDV